MAVKYTQQTKLAIFFPPAVLKTDILTLSRIDF